MIKELAMNRHDENDLSVEHFLAEHRRLYVMLRLARSAILHSGGPNGSGTSADVVRVLRQVRDEFAQHFAEEDTSNYIKRIAARGPELSQQALRIQGEHSELLGNVDKLIAQALDSSQSVQDRVAIEKAFDDLCEQLYAHESAENDLLRQGCADGPRDKLRVSIGAGDA